MTHKHYCAASCKAEWECSVDIVAGGVVVHLEGYRGPVRHKPTRRCSDQYEQLCEECSEDLSYEHEAEEAANGVGYEW